MVLFRLPFRVVGIPADLARQTRETLKSPQYGHPAHVEVAKGYGPFLPLTLEGYGQDRWIVARERVSDGEIEAAIERVFTSPEVRYIHVRNTEAGCFIALIERMD